ncbi:MAG: ABC transporter permease, partial [Planctomycetes bacterium]|nr:ABC transporter permease [Planctomycetota bacterium]
MIVAVLAATGRSVISARQWFLTTAAETGAALIMLGRALAYTRLIGRSLPQLRRQLDEAGFGSIVVLSLIAGLTGMIVAVQTGSALEEFG